MAQRSNSGGIGFFGVLQAMFIAFKLAGVVDWSWWTVFAPTLIPILLLIFIAVIFS